MPPMRTQALPTGPDARPRGKPVVDWPHGERIGPWRAVALLGSGGTAEVWHAVAADGRDAALKVARRELRGHAAGNAPIRHEHDVLRRVASPHLVEPYELFEHDGSAVLALEYLPHGDLVSLVGMPPRLWLPAFRVVLAALADLERHGLAHGDLKARNVLFAADGSARLTDLVYARPLDAPAVITTRAYGVPAPRRACARDADRFALAVLLFELTTGRLPFGPDGAAAGRPVPPGPAPEGPEAPLLRAAVGALRADGRIEGLSYFTDVIESVRSVYG
jgi:serine/threonine protein kinase